MGHEFYFILKDNELHAIKPEGKTIERSASERVTLLVQWYVWYAHSLGLTLAEATL